MGPEYTPAHSLRAGGGSTLFFPMGLIRRKSAASVVGVLAYSIFTSMGKLEFSHPKCCFAAGI